MWLSVNNSISVIDTAINTVTVAVPVGNDPNGITVPLNIAPFNGQTGIVVINTIPCTVSAGQQFPITVVRNGYLTGNIKMTLASTGATWQGPINGMTVTSDTTIFLIKFKLCIQN
jgi:YVTN family beta-propeller protein